jgi:hypothetical protein
MQSRGPIATIAELMFSRPCKALLVPGGGVLVAGVVQASATRPPASCDDDGETGLSPASSHQLKLQGVHEERCPYQEPTSHAMPWAVSLTGPSVANVPAKMLKSRAFFASSGSICLAGTSNSADWPFQAEPRQTSSKARRQPLGNSS